jgi:hypothetical protein
MMANQVKVQAMDVNNGPDEELRKAFFSLEQLNPKLDLLNKPHAIVRLGFMTAPRILAEPAAAFILFYFIFLITPKQWAPSGIGQVIPADSVYCVL